MILNTILVSGTTPDGNKLVGGDTAVGVRYTPVESDSSVVVVGDEHNIGIRHNTRR